jgi:hypothetical protein
MKYSIFFLFLVLAFTGSLPAFNGDNDSLLFDGTADKRKMNESLGCNILVTYSDGNTKGTKLIKEEFEICGQKEVINRTEAGQLKKGDVLRIGDEISTGPDGNLEIEYYDGSIMRLGPNSSVKIENDWCTTNSVKIQMIMGKFWTKVKKILGGGKFEVSTERNGGGVRGTEFSFEIVNDIEVIKVYEGEFEVYPPKNMSEMNDMSIEIEKLTKEYQEGKMTIQEYMDKVNEYTDRISTISDNATKSVFVKGGNMVKVTNVISQPEPIPSDDSNWFEDSKFIK